MLNKLKRDYRQFKEDEPGERFLNTHERWKTRSNEPAATILVIVVGAILIIGGFVLGLVPGVPGILLGVLGFALIATRFRRMAIWLDWSEIKMRRVWRKCRRVAAHL